ncbi:YAN2-like protein [Mya arenaria]|uniref:YAN2-like protein n=1 Tax=Mya arenaria TaxID=6604 RepID=A0ABY7GAB9_MYAAR|nr:YAN2-like protein [Mya arenaria]
MQARENSGESRTHLEMVRAMYPGHCGYSSETGGVCDYHRDFYRPENLCLIITGQINVDDVFRVLAPFEDKISAVPPLDASADKVVKYAADDEEHGIDQYSYASLNLLRDYLTDLDQYSYASLSLLLDYLTDSAISPLQREFVEIDEPFCSDVHGSMIENSECAVYFKFDNVVTSKLNKIYSRLKEVLGGLSSGQEKLDMARIGNLAHRKVLEGLSAMEDDPHNRMASFLIGDFLFSDNQEDMENRVQTVQAYKRMKEEPESFWIGLISQYFIDKNYVLILGEPSVAERESLAKTEADRVTKQREALGKDGLQQKAEILEKATEENEKEAPESVLTSVSVPDVADIFFHPISPSCNRPAVNEKMQAALVENAAFPLDKIPFRFQLDDTHTNFKDSTIALLVFPLFSDDCTVRLQKDSTKALLVPLFSDDLTMTVLLDSSSVQQKLHLFSDDCTMTVLLDSSSVPQELNEYNSILIGHKEVISQLEAETLYTSCGLGVRGSHLNCGTFPQAFEVKIGVEKEKYETGVRWLREILYQTKFPADRLKTVAKRMNSTISQYKRKGNAVMRALIRSIIFSPARPTVA